jgi:hypothetical protein
MDPMYQDSRSASFPQPSPAVLDNPGAGTNMPPTPVGINPTVIEDSKRLMFQKMPKIKPGDQDAYIKDFLDGKYGPEKRQLAIEHMKRISDYTAEKFKESQQKGVMFDNTIGGLQPGTPITDKGSPLEVPTQIGPIGPGVPGPIGPGIPYGEGGPGIPGPIGPGIPYGEGGLVMPGGIGPVGVMGPYGPITPFPQRGPMGQFGQMGAMGRFEISGPLAEVINAIRGMIGGVRSGYYTGRFDDRTLIAVALVVSALLLV